MPEIGISQIQFKTPIYVQVPLAGRLPARHKTKCLELIDINFNKKLAFCAFAHFCVRTFMGINVWV